MSRKEMNARREEGDSTSRPDLRPRILRLLDEAAWHYDEESDELEIALPGGEGREGLAFPVDDFYVRVDPDSYEPLSIIVPGYRAWAAEQPPVLKEARPETWTGIASRTAEEAIRRAVRESAELADARVWAQ